MSDALRVALIAEGTCEGVGGIAVHARELARALAAQGHAVTVVSAEQYSERRNLDRLRIRLRMLPPDPPLAVWEAPLLWTPRRMLTPLQIAWRLRPWLRRLLDQEAVQVAHWHGIDVDCQLSLGLGGGIARVFTNHSSQFLEAAAMPEERSPMARRLAHAQHVIAPSRELVERSVEVLAEVGLLPERVHYVPNGVDVQRFRPDRDSGRAFRRELRIADEAIVTVCARRLVAKNGVIHLAEAAARLDALSGPPVVLLMAGDGSGGHADYERRVREVLAKATRRVRVQWLGWVPTERMPPVLAAADIALLPSLVEATSLAGLEAMASGCALLGTRVGGIPEMVEHGRSGWLVAPGDAAALLDGWRRLIDDETLRLALGEAARAEVRSNYSWEAIARRTVAVYRTALGELATRGAARGSEARA